MATPTTTLFVIDAQNDFVDTPKDLLPMQGQTGNPMYQPALPVTGAYQDMRNLAEFINRAGTHITSIVATLDSHHHVGIERVTFWMDASGNQVPPYTLVTAADVRQGKYLPRAVGLTNRVLSYLDALEASAGRHVHMIWPVHCEIGTWGAGIQPDVLHAFNRWEEQRVALVNKVTKGSNPLAEHFSIFRAEVADPSDPSTQLNTRLIQTLGASDRIIVAGEAGSHCVKRSLEDLLENLPQDALQKVIILTDCVSPVTGFESNWTEFLTRVKAQGVNLSTSVDMLPRMF